MEQLVASRVIGQDHRHFLAVLLLLAVWLAMSNHFQASAQQQYNNVTGYVCSDSEEKSSCDTFVLYRAQGSYSTVRQIAELFNTDAAMVANLSKLSEDQMLMGNAVIIPITCRCGSDSTSFANISYTIVEYDTFITISLNTFEGLSTTNETEAVNSNLDPHNLAVGEKIIFPLRCACPSNAQLSDGVKSLVTYPIAEGDTVRGIASSFGVLSADVVHGNTLSGADDSILQNTTLLIPINGSQPNYTHEAPPPAAA